MPNASLSPSVLKVYGALKSAHVATRPDLARFTGLSLTAVGMVVDALSECGLITLAAAESVGRRGRPAQDLTVNPGGHTVAVVDLSGAYLQSGVFDLYGNLLSRNEGGPVSSFVGMKPAQVAELLAQGLKQYQGVEAYGVTTTGVVSAAGVVERSWYLAVDKPYDMRGQLERLLGAPVHFENDASASALGEFRSRKQLKDETLLYFNYAHGIGIGLVMGGKLHRGSRGAAGNYALVPADASGFLPNSDRSTLARLLADVVHPERKAALQTTSSAGMWELAIRTWFGMNTDAADPIGTLLQQGANRTPGARELLDKATRQAALVLAYAASTVDADVIVLQNAWPQAQAMVLKPVSAMLKASVRAPITLSKLGKAAGLHGIGALVAEDLEQRLLTKADALVRQA